MRTIAVKETLSVTRTRWDRPKQRGGGWQSEGLGVEGNSVVGDANKIFHPGGGKTSPQGLRVDL